MKNIFSKEKFFWERISTELCCQGWVVEGWGACRDCRQGSLGEQRVDREEEGVETASGLGCSCSSSSGPTTAPDLRLAAHCSRLTLPTQTLTPSANTNKATYLHCLTKVNSPVRAQALPSPSRSSCWAKGMHGVMVTYFLLLAGLLIQVVSVE